MALVRLTTDCRYPRLLPAKGRPLGRVISQYMRITRPSVGRQGRMVIGVRVRPKHKVALLSVHKPGNGAAVKADTLLEGIGKVPGKDRDVFLIAENIAERQTYKFYVVIFDIVQDILCSMLHGGILQI